MKKLSLLVLSSFLLSHMAAQAGVAPAQMAGLEDIARKMGEDGLSEEIKEVLLKGPLTLKSPAVQACLKLKATGNKRADLDALHTALAQIRHAAGVETTRVVAPLPAAPSRDATPRRGHPAVPRLGLERLVPAPRGGDTRLLPPLSPEDSRPAPAAATAARAGRLLLPPPAPEDSRPSTPTPAAAEAASTRRAEEGVYMDVSMDGAAASAHGSSRADARAPHRCERFDNPHAFLHESATEADWVACLTQSRAHALYNAVVPRMSSDFEGGMEIVGAFMNDLLTVSTQTGDAWAIQDATIRAFAAYQRYKRATEHAAHMRTHSG